MFLSGLSRMVYEYFSRCFIPGNLSLRFSKLFQAIVVVCKVIFRLVALMIGVNKLLAMAKDIGGLHPIAIGKMFFQLISCSIVVQL